MFKINQFFPSRLTQYQNQCVSQCVHTTIASKVLSVNKFYHFFFFLFHPKSQREIFLMKKNHLDFKNLAQSLAVDKGKLERYVEVSFLL